MKTPANILYLAIFLFPCLAVAGDTAVEEPETEIVIGGAAEPEGEELLLSEVESEACANEVVGGLVEGKLAEEIAGMAVTLATALKEQCQCDAVAVRTMTEAGVPFDVSFNTIAEVCELDGTELGELSRDLGPGLGATAEGGPGGDVSP